MDVAKESVYWIFRMIIIGIAITFIILIVNSSNYNILSDNFESYIIRNKLIMDEECLAYGDYRTRLGIIDKGKFNKLNLEGCINPKKVGVILNLTYEGFSEEIIFNEYLANKIDFCYDAETFLCIQKNYNLITKNGLKDISSGLSITTISLKDKK